MNPEDRLFGEIAIKLGMVERSALGGFVAEMMSRPGEVGAILLEAGLLSQAQVQTVMGHLERILEQRGQKRAPASRPALERRHSVAPPSQKETANRPSLAPAAPALRTSSIAAPYLPNVLEHAVQRGASDVHVHVGAPISFRVAGKLVPIDDIIVSSSDAEKMLAQLLPHPQWERLAADGQVDFAHAIEGVGRFRVNAYRQQRGMDAVFRVIPARRRNLSELGLPSSLQRLTDFRTGLVLCTGPTGSGKSTTLAALLDAIVDSRKDHVITMEDPIEHVFVSKGSWINQREVESHTQSYARALRAALREDPDIIAITELRDRDTISLALTAAETGHLVLATVNTNSAGQTISRIVNAFPGDEQGHVRSSLSESLRAVVSQKLIPTVDEATRVPAVEILIGTTAVANMIRDNKTFQLPSLMQTGTSLGMVTLDTSLLQLVADGKVTKQVAQRFATAKERFK